MAEDVATLEAQLDRLRTSLAQGVRKVQYSDGRSHEFYSVAEMERVAAHLEQRIARMNGGRAVQSVRIFSSKGV